MNYTLKRSIKVLAVLLAVALIAAGVLYGINKAVSLGDGINHNTDKKYESSEPFVQDGVSGLSRTRM